jgi:hypothetical protein
MAARCVIPAVTSTAVQATAARANGRPNEL